jgi:hypothetical protein
MVRLVFSLALHSRQNKEISWYAEIGENDIFLLFLGFLCMDVWKSSYAVAYVG